MISPLNTFEEIREEDNEEERNINYYNNTRRDIFKTSMKKKRGRKGKNLSNSYHDKYSLDNLLTKIQVNFLSYIISLSNDAINTIFGPKTKFNFKNLSYQIKQRVNFNSIEQNKKSTIYKLIFNSEISKKYKHINKNINKETLIKVCSTSEWLDNFLNNSFINIFHYYYNNNEDKPLEKIYFQEKEINLSQKTQKYSFSYLVKKKNNISIKQDLIDIVKNIILKDDNIFNGAKFVAK